MWRSGEALRPYFQDVLQLLRKLRELKASDPRAVPVISAPDATDFVHFPIVDCNVADDTKVREVELVETSIKPVHSNSGEVSVYRIFWYSSSITNLKVFVSSEIRSPPPSPVRKFRFLLCKYVGKRHFAVRNLFYGKISWLVTVSPPGE